MCIFGFQRESQSESCIVKFKRLKLNLLKNKFAPLYHMFHFVDSMNLYQKMFFSNPQLLNLTLCGTMCSVVNHGN